jgi:ABC-type multidrug transport system ATPase subunit
MAHVLVKLKQASVRRGMQTVFDNMDVEIRQHNVRVLIGTNGSGKSTLIETLLGLVPLENGKLEHNESLVLDSDGRRKKSMLDIGVALQSNGVLGSETVTEHLENATMMYGKTIDTTPFLEAFSLLHRRHDLVATLSAGQRRKVAVLAAVLPAFASDEPTLIALDEPDAGLDEHTIAILVTWIAHLSDAGHGIVISSHQGVFAQVATHVQSMDTNTVELQEPTSFTKMDDFPRSEPKKALAASTFGLRQQFRTMRWLNHNGLAALMTLGVFMAILPLPIGSDSMEHLGFMLAPALAIGLCGDGLVVMLREERSLSWWKATANTTPHSSWLPFALGCIMTILSSSVLAGIEAVSVELVLSGTILAGCLAHIMRFIQLQVEQLARPHAVFIGLLTPILILPFALLLDVLAA